MPVADLAAQRARWPSFADEAMRVGFRAVYALPMRLRSDSIGALNLFHRDPDTITDRFNRLVDRAGVKRIRLHDVRHTYATVSLDSGVDPKIVADILWASSTITMSQGRPATAGSVSGLGSAANRWADRTPLF